MKPKQVRFSTEEAILKAIDDAQNRSAAALTHAAELEADIKAKTFELETCYSIANDALRRRSDIEKAELAARTIELQIKQHRAKIEKLQKTATNLTEKRCKRLGKALSAFRTMPMGVIVGDDQSVVLV